MGIFSSIKNAIFGDDDDKKVEHEAKPASKTVETARPRPVSTMDLEEALDNKPGSDKLNWRTSIVDLMKLVGIDPSYENRKELAAELGDNYYSGTAEENIWLHRQVMAKIAAEGGKVPRSLLD
ncbi:DUF3597 domain-containing protein [Aurantiacibacter sediminis]|uniref:DUF3597 domain-containing protein n=1 Tax=Aurantiacibacter sediminis TaxID=2793064 RepID=A0ABS0N4S6_9SPHN|nr:DUF3597 domain-containing protein [Aurantiacibacter sediminis]MBH5322705.1 DUF3597 domain-containing protein [Aurantiacibacter sediminis]